MVMINYLNKATIKNVISEIGSEENKKRKSKSLADYDIFKDNLGPYVKKYLEGMYSSETVREMPIIASINLARRSVIQEASIYNEPPKRTFTGLSEEQEAVVRQVYADMQIDKILHKSNQYYKLQHQGHIQIIPFGGKLSARVLLNHHLDVVPSPMNPEMADAYIINGFDKSQSVLKEQDSDTINQSIGDKDDYKKNLLRFAFWSDQFNFIADQDGNILSGEDTSNSLEMMPFVEIAPDKDFEYWVTGGASVVDFTIQFNGALSDLGHIVRMQGFAQAWMKGPANLIPENIQIGPNFVLKLPVDPNNPVDTDFGYSNPSPDLGGSIQYVEMLLANFLSSRGLDPKLVSGKGEAEKFSSGIERLLSMISKFEASRSDLTTYEHVEKKIFKIVAQYLNKMSGSILDYRVAPIPEDASVSVEFKKPEMIKTDADKLDLVQRKREMGLMSRVDAIMEVYGLDKESALEKIKEIDEEFTVGTDTTGASPI